MAINMYFSKYPVIRKIAKYDFGMAISVKDVPISGQMGNSGGVNNYGFTLANNGQQHKDPEDDYFDIYWMDSAGYRYVDRFAQLKNH